MEVRWEMTDSEDFKKQIRDAKGGDKTTTSQIAVLRRELDELRDEMRTMISIRSATSSEPIAPQGGLQINPMNISREFDHEIQHGEINYIREGDKANLRGKVEGRKIYFTLIYKKGSFLITELSFTDYKYLERACFKFLKAISSTKGFYNEPLITYKTPPLISQSIKPIIIPIKADQIIHEWWRRKIKDGKERFHLLQGKERKGEIINLQSDLKKPRS